MLLVLAEVAQLAVLAPHGRLELSTPAAHRYCSNATLQRSRPHSPPPGVVQLLADAAENLFRLSAAPLGFFDVAAKRSRFRLQALQPRLRFVIASGTVDTALEDGLLVATRAGLVQLFAKTTELMLQVLLSLVSLALLVAQLALFLGDGSLQLAASADSGDPRDTGQGHVS
jgi:hypothetical protein